MDRLLSPIVEKASGKEMAADLRSTFCFQDLSLPLFQPPDVGYLLARGNGQNCPKPPHLRGHVGMHSA